MFATLRRPVLIEANDGRAVEEETKAEVRCYKFIENYRPDMMNEPTGTEGRKLILVLYGQHRHTTLLIGLRDTFSEKVKGVRSTNASAWSAKTLFLDLLKEPDPRSADDESDNEFGITFGLAFHDRRPEHTTAGTGSRSAPCWIMPAKRSWGG